ncbi:cadherin-99C isoform X2 [Eucyclogobius newberryi]|uniref:cadherin-99C isoform X2 n=1 Tax=Eucyclogobius newberryi TaxID=166745 RepID=UPI003B5B4916
MAPEVERRQEMAHTQILLHVLRAKSHIFAFLLLLQSPWALGTSGWGGCLDGQDVFAAVSENSPPLILSPELFGDWTEDSFSWIVRGRDAYWFFLDGTNLWLNTSAEKVLDRETEGAVLMAELVCYEQDTLQSVYRIVVEILNENDNSPVFVDGPVQSAVISELTPVNTVVFKVKATDADNDKIMYTIEQTSPDADYFKLVLPYSGDVVLAKPLDYESKTLLRVVVHASEVTTVEQHRTSTHVSITVQDGDDQYPQFMPCTVLYEEAGARVCVNPTYTANVTEGQQDVVLSFSPGPIYAVDGDSGLSASISYGILTGNADGHFLLNRHTGEMSLTQGFSDRLTTPTLHLQVMAFQDNDPRKYSVAEVKVNVLAHNQFPPVFEKSEYPGFVTMGHGAAALVHTYGNRELVFTVTDKDFNQSTNPMIVFNLSPSSNHRELYTVTKEGLVIAKTSHLNPREKHVIQVRAVDQESGESAFTTVTVEVLAEGQAVPHSKWSEQRLSGCVVGKVFFLCLLGATLGLCVMYLSLWIRKRLQAHRDPLERGSVAQAKHPNVSLRWFQLVSHGSAITQMEDLPFSADDCGTSNPSFSYSDQDSPSQPEQSSTDNNKATESAHENATGSSQDTESLETLLCHTPLRLSEHLSILESASSSPSPPLSPDQVMSRCLAAAEIDKPFYKVPTPPKRTFSPPTSPEQKPVKARLVHIHSSPSDSLCRRKEEMPAEAEPSTSLDNLDHSSPDGLEEDAFFEEERMSPDLLPEDRELLDVMEKCYPVIVTFRK